MNINLIKNITSSSSAVPAGGKAGKSAGMCGKERTYKTQNNYGIINTSIKRNPDARVSFKGAEPLLYKAANWAAKGNNQLIVEALVLAPLTCIIKPAILLFSGKTEDDKKKYQYQAAKSFGTGIAGFVMTVIAGLWIKKSIDASKDVFKVPESAAKPLKEAAASGIEALKQILQKLKNNGGDSELAGQIEKLTENGKLNLDVLYNQFEKLDKKAMSSFLKNIEKVSPENAQTVKKAVDGQNIIDNYYSTAKNAANKMLQPVFMPLRAQASMYTIPIFLSWFGLKKTCSKPKADQNMYSRLNHDVFKDKNSELLFQPFWGGKK